MGRPRHISDSEILDVARDVLHECPTASTLTIAERVGLSQAALFKRFGTKLGMLHKAFDLDAAPGWVGMVEAGPDERPIPDQLREIGFEIDAFFRRLVPSVAALKALGIDLRSLFTKTQLPPPVRGYEALRGWFARAMAAGLIRPSDPGASAIAFMGAFQARAFWRYMAGSHFPTPLPDDEVYIASVVEVFWRGLSPEELP